jgi:hypothetical protein
MRRGVLAEDEVCAAELVDLRLALGLGVEFAAQLVALADLRFQIDVRHVAQTIYFQPLYEPGP